jgi:hypothetical protein
MYSKSVTLARRKTWQISVPAKCGYFREITADLLATIVK